MKTQEKLEKDKVFLKEKLKNIKNNPLDTLPQIVNILIIICGLTCLIFSYIIFLNQEGYPKNIDIYKFNELFTKGTVSYFYNKIFIIIISVLVAINLVFIFINYFINEKKHKIISAVFLIISILSISLYFIAYQIIYNRDIEIPQKVLSSNLFWIFINTKTLPTLGIIVFVTSIVYIIFLLRSDTKSLIIKTLISLFITFCVFPIVVLCMENIILGIIAIILLTIYSLFFMPRCKKCKGIFCLEKGETKLVSKSSISIKTKTNNYDNNGNVIGTSDTYVPGIRYTYETEYTCKKCGKKTYKLSFNDYKNTWFETLKVQKTVRNQSNRFLCCIHY